MNLCSDKRTQFLLITLSMRSAYITFAIDCTHALILRSQPFTPVGRNKGLATRDYPRTVNSNQVMVVRNPSLSRVHAQGKVVLSLLSL